MDTKLLPCPFCGGEGHVSEVDLNYCRVIKYEYVPQCCNDDCCAELIGYDTEAEAVEVWNGRVSHE